MTSSSLPAGCGQLPGEEDEGPCLICARPIDDCVCPECPTCQTVGDPRCYREHGLRLNKAQAVGRRSMQVYQAQEHVVAAQAGLEWVSAQPDDYEEEMS